MKFDSLKGLKENQALQVIPFQVVLLDKSTQNFQSFQDPKNGIQT